METLASRSSMAGHDTKNPLTKLATAPLILPDEDSTAQAVARTTVGKRSVVTTLMVFQAT